MNDMTPVNELDRCKPWLEAALEYGGGTHTFDDIVKGVQEGRMQLWPAPRGCIVTEIVVYPRVKAINIFLAGGELDQILDMDEDVKAWARDQGCTQAHMSGRLGWKKPLAPLGWEIATRKFPKGDIK